VKLLIEKEMKKHGIELHLLSQVLSFFHESIDRFIYEEFMTRRMIVLLLTRDYFESKKFRKLYKEAKRLNKKITLVKLEGFYMDLEEYPNVHDISRHEDCRYDGYLTRRFFEGEVGKNCRKPVRLFSAKYFVRYFKEFVEGV
jgi:hypothetical protein